MRNKVEEHSKSISPLYRPGRPNHPQTPASCHFHLRSRHHHSAVLLGPYHRSGTGAPPVQPTLQGTLQFMPLYNLYVEQCTLISDA